MIINIKNLYYEINQNVVFKDFSLYLKGPGLYMICGNNGIGKTTLLSLINKDIAQGSGNIEIDGEVSYAHYSELLFTNLTVRKNLKLCCREISSIQNELNIFDLEAILDLKVNKLSKGERMRLYLLMIILRSKDIILLDEVTAYLDSAHEEKIIKYLKELSQKKLILLATNQKNILGYATNIIYLNKEMNFSCIQTFENKNIILYNQKNILSYIDYKISSIFMLISMLFLFVSVIFFGFSNTYNKKNIVLNEIKACDENYVLFSSSYEYFSNISVLPKNEEVLIKNIDFLSSYIYLSDDLNEDEIILDLNSYNKLLDNKIIGFFLENNQMICKLDNSFSFKIRKINKVSNVSAINKKVYNRYCQKFPLKRIAIPYSLELKFLSNSFTTSLKQCYISDELAANTIAAPIGFDSSADIIINNMKVTDVNVINNPNNYIILSTDIAYKLSEYYDVFYASDYAYGIGTTKKYHSDLKDILQNDKGYIYFNKTEAYNKAIIYGKENNMLFKIISYLSFVIFVVTTLIEIYTFKRRNTENIKALNNFKYSISLIKKRIFPIILTFIIIFGLVFLMGLVYNLRIGLNYDEAAFYFLYYDLSFYLYACIFLIVLIGKGIIMLKTISNKQKS